MLATFQTNEESVPIILITILHDNHYLQWIKFKSFSNATRKIFSGGLLYLNIKKIE